MKSIAPAFVFIALLLAPRLVAEQAPNNALGFQPGKSFQMGDYDTVNLFNGNLTVALPVGPSFTPGGNLAYGFHLFYNGNAWVMAGDTSQPEAIPNRFSNAGLGWKLSLGELVAPHDLAILDVSEGDSWTYLSADGSAHAFFAVLHSEEGGTVYAGSDSLVVNTVVGYTQDGSYLRLRRGTRSTNHIAHPCPLFPGFCYDYTVAYSIEAPDGNIHSFEAQVSKGIRDGEPTVEEDSNLSYHLVSIVDRFGNYLHVTYPDPLTWVVKDGTPSTGDIRTHTVHLLNETFYEFRGEPTAHLFVDRIDLAAFNGQTATYQFNYSGYETISKYCDDMYPGDTAKTRFLNSVTQPDGSAFAMDYVKVVVDPETNQTSCSKSAGHLLALTFPTGGKLQYTMGQRLFPREIGDIGTGGHEPHRIHSIGVETRQLVDSTGAAVGTWTYHANLTSLTAYHYGTNGVSLEPRGLAVTVNDPGQRTNVYYFNVDQIGTIDSCYPGAPGDSEYAMPFTYMAGTAASDGFLLSSEAYDGLCTIHIPSYGSGCTRSCLDANSSAIQPARSMYVRYEQDWTVGFPADQNRRLKKRRTVFNSDTGCGGTACAEETDFDDFDGLGHYRTQTHASKFPPTNDRVSTTHYNARGGTYVPGGGSSPDAYMIAPGSPWLPAVYDLQTTTESNQTAKSEFCFNSATAFLERRRTWRNADRTRDLLATFAQAGGNITTESYSGGDTRPLTGGFATCTSNPGTPVYRLTHHYTAGSVDSTQYDGVTFKSLDQTIDSNTGLPSASKDSSASLVTTYAYDKMQRLTDVHPPSDAWTKYTYSFGAHPSVSILRRPFGSSSEATPETSNYIYFDSFGRSVLSKEQFPEGWSATRTAYDAVGRIISTSMPEFRSSSSCEDFSPAHVTSTTYDHFDRPLSVTMPDGKVTTFSYTGSRVTNRTNCVAASQTQAPCQAGEFPFTTTETADGHGRLSTITERIGGGVVTTYGYDVGNRLATVSTNAPEGVQQRFFNYDLAGLLISEKHPEKGIAGNGTVTYPEYDERGHLHRRIDGADGGAFDITFAYDSAERLINIQDLDPTTHDRRDLKVFDYAIDNQTGNPRLGKLQTATRHNYQTSLGGDIPVAETYTYGGPNGRVSSRATTVGGAFPANTFTLAQTWDDLGDIRSVTYPTNAALASTPARTVGNTYTNALLTGVTGYTTSMTHLANGVLSLIAHANGATEQWTADPSGMPRPNVIHLTSNGGGDKILGPYAYDATGNIKQIGDATGTHTNYLYDGAGRLTRLDAVTPPSLTSLTLSQTWSYDTFGNKLGAPQQHQFDPNGDGVVSPTDIFYLVNYLFLEGPPPRGSAGLLSGDANGDGRIDPSDIFFTVNYLFLDGVAPNIPVAELPTGDELLPTTDNVDAVTVGTVTATGNTVDVPVNIRVRSGTLMGGDLPSRPKIQSFAIKVAYSPAEAVSSVAFVRAGITASLSPSAQFTPAGPHSVSLVDTFQEATNLIPFTLNATAPGDLVAHLVVTLSSSATPGSTISLSLDPTVTLLANAEGTMEESPARGTLALVDGAIHIPGQMLTATPSSVVARQEESTARMPNPNGGGGLMARSSAAPTPGTTGSIFPTRGAGPASSSMRLRPIPASYTGTTNHDTSFVYDAAGDVMLDDQGRAYTYDGLSMATGASLPLTGGGARNFAYLYTADDERIGLVEKLSSGETKALWTLRGLDNRLLRTWTDTTTSGSHSWSWSEDEIWRGGSLLAFVSPNGVRHDGLDHLGSPVLLTDSSGNLFGNVSYDAFGSGGGTGAGMLQYTGHERDSATAGPQSGTARLPDYLHARYYDANAGRFLSVDRHSGDPQRPQSWNRYEYASNNPITRVDPNGLNDQMFVVNTLGAGAFSRADAAALARAVVGTRFEGNVHVIGPYASNAAAVSYVQHGDSTDAVAIIAHSGPYDVSGAPVGAISSARAEQIMDSNGAPTPALAISGSTLGESANNGSAPTVMIAGCASLMCASSVTRLSGAVAFGTTNLTLSGQDGKAVVATFGAFAQGVTPFAAALLGSKALTWTPTPADCAGLDSRTCTPGAPATVQSTQPSQ
jgi:RHS repeat-associated protein